MIDIRLGDNLEIMQELTEQVTKANLIYGDCVYESKDFRWIDSCYNLLNDNGIIIVQTDWHTSHWYRLYLEYKFGTDNFLNHLVWKNEWGNHPKDRFHQCYDDIIIFKKDKEHKFYSDRIQVPKATARANGLNPSGRSTKTATAWIDDIVLTTTSKERVKKSDGHLIRWQKPLKLFDRIFLPFTDENDLIIDPFSGSGTTAVWAKQNNRNLIGIENNKEVYELSLERLELN